MKYQVIKGTKDVLPPETEQWQWLERIIRRAMSCYRYQEIRTPAFEMTELFKRSIGEGTDIVNKEMYSFTDNGRRHLTLKPEGTAPVVRAYLQHSLGKGASLVKLYYLSPLFRQENPQAGRLREHHQFGVEAFGSDDPALDYEVISLLTGIYRQCGLSHYRLQVNTIGCRQCRPGYIEQFKRYLAPERTGLCHDCSIRYEVNPLRIFDCKQAACQRLVQEAPAINEAVCDSCQKHFEMVRSYLQENGIPFQLDKRLVRGLDYYTQTTFEVKCDQLGAQNTIGGGGRYNDLVEELGGEAVSAVGFGSGIERLLLALEKQQRLPGPDNRISIFCAVMDQPGRRAALPVVQALRDAGLPTELNYLERSLKAQLREANRSGAGNVLIFGEDEVARQQVMLKDMTSGHQEQVALSDVVQVLQGRMAPAPLPRTERETS